MAYFTKGDIAQLDLVAIAILFESNDKAKEHYAALKAKGAPKLGDDPTLKCVAVALVGDTLYVGTNNIWITNELRESLKGKSAELSGTMVNNINRGHPIAENAVELSSFRQEVTDGLARILGYSKVVFVEGTATYLNNYHAEMQLLDWFMNNGIVPGPRYFGVSKPCCPECTAILNRAKIDFTESHTKNAHVRRNVEEHVNTQQTSFGGPSLHPHLDTEKLARYADID